MGKIRRRKKKEGALKMMMMSQAKDYGGSYVYLCVERLKVEYFW